MMFINDTHTQIHRHNHGQKQMKLTKNFYKQQPVCMYDDYIGWHIGNIGKHHNIRTSVHCKTFGRCTQFQYVLWTGIDGCFHLVFIFERKLLLLSVL